jgi:hypothetical protein
MCNFVTFILYLDMNFEQNMSESLTFLFQLRGTFLEYFGSDTP